MKKMKDETPAQEAKRAEGEKSDLEKINEEIADNQKDEASVTFIESPHGAAVAAGAEGTVETLG